MTHEWGGVEMLPHPVFGCDLPVYACTCGFHSEALAQLNTHIQERNSR